MARTLLLASDRMRTSELDYDLPPELIAQAPPARRDASRLLVAERAGGGEVRHRRFGDLPDELPRGALVVVNDTRVVPARLRLRPNLSEPSRCCARMRRRSRRRPAAPR